MKDALIKTVRILDKTIVLASWPGRIAAWLCLPIIALSIFSVIASLFRVHTFLRWANPVFLFGTELNSTSVVELQWHLFAVMMLFAGAYTFAKDRHVRVDILYARMSAKLKLVVNAAGDLLFLLPFTIFVVIYSLNLVQFSYMINETSSEFGLTHRWVVKTVLPIGMSLLGLQAACRGVGGILRIILLSVGVDIGPQKMVEDEPK